MLTQIGQVSDLEHDGTPRKASDKNLEPNMQNLQSMSVTNVEIRKLIPSIEQPPELELKPLPSNLKYVYLVDDDKLPVIIANSLTSLEEDKLIGVLRRYKEAIGWTLADIPGINPSICTHRILLNEGVKPVRQPQRRLNPLILDVVKKEVSKL